MIMRPRSKFGGLSRVGILGSPFAPKEERRSRRFRPPELDVRAIRRRARLNRSQFAQCFGIPVETLRHWERGDRKPRGAALVLLHVIERDPRAVIRALGSRFYVTGVPRYVPI